MVAGRISSPSLVDGRRGRGVLRRGQPGSQDSFSSSLQELLRRGIEGAIGRGLLEYLSMLAEMNRKVLEETGC